jgi:integration host factor subunit beta
VAIFFEEMAEALSKGGRVEIRGMSSFFVKYYDGYTGRNPKTGVPTQVKPKKLPFFKCGMELKKRVNNPETISKEQRKRKDRRYHDAKILEPDLRNGKDRRRN